MGRHNIVMNEKTQHSKDVKSPQTDIQDYHNTYQNSRRVFYRYRQDYSIIYKESYKKVLDKTSK